MLCISDQKLYEIMIKNQTFIQNNPSCRLIGFFNVHFWRRILNVLKDHVLHRILEEINNNGGKFGIEIDSTQDVSKKHQVSVVVKYVTENALTGLIVKERTVIFKPIGTATGEGLSSFLKNNLQNIGLRVENITGIYTPYVVPMQ